MNYNGLAKIISFTPRAQVRVGPPWSTSELGELFRVAHVLRQSGMVVETDMGLSDEGDPWFVYFSAHSEEVIAHFARINGKIVVHGLSTDGVVSGTDLHEVVQRLKPIKTMERQQTSQNDRSVSIHPFMILVAFVAASFLATEESKAAGESNQTPIETADTHDNLAKTKSDWFDRALAFLNSKAKERIDSGVADGARKTDTGDSLHHSMALVMLAAAISQAQTEILSFGETQDLDIEPTSRTFAGHQRAAGNGAIADIGIDGTAALVAEAPQGSAGQMRPDARTTSEAENLIGQVGDIAAWAALGDWVGAMTSAPSLPTAPLLTDARIDASLPVSQSALPLVEDIIAIPDVAPVRAMAALASTAGATTASGAKLASTPVSTTSVSAGTSFDLTFEGGALQFHQTSIDIRSIEVIMGQSEKVDTKTPDVKLEAGPLPPLQPTIKMFVLTDAEENILVDSGDIRVKNFTFGVDQLIIADPSLVMVAPQVQYSMSGDIIIKFSETTRVVLLGVFQPSETFMSVASVAYVDSV